MTGVVSGDPPQQRGNAPWPYLLRGIRGSQPPTRFRRSHPRRTYKVADLANQFLSRNTPTSARGIGDQPSLIAMRDVSPLVPLRNATTLSQFSSTGGHPRPLPRPIVRQCSGHTQDGFEWSKLVHGSVVSQSRILVRSGQQVRA